MTTAPTQHLPEPTPGTGCRRDARHGRVLNGRHTDGCALEGCPGCQPCTRPHCRVCGKAHAEHTCPDCLSDVRENLAKIRTLCTTFATEAAHRGLNSEAMNLLGPVANVEARHHAETSYLEGRLPEGWLETGKHGKHCPTLANEPCTGCGGSDLHPLTMAWWWNERYRTALDHDPTPTIGPRYDHRGRRGADYGVPDLVAYLERNLSYAATYPDVPFEDFARAVARCLTHIEEVLHAGDQVEHGAPCQQCKRPVTVTTDDQGRVTYACDRCNTTLTPNQYRMAVRAEYVANADRLNAIELAERIDVPVSTIRRWANVVRIQKTGEDPVEIPALMKSCGRDGRQLKVYRVAEALRIKEAGDHRRAEGRMDQ